ncbi:hypothetical protein CC80DRAFT_544858 [Byssothecium circinans]|uniref:Uncharacterized protein n=1 Tax=Byssothecium circinans TaxID=147558 RepID=A0A6A5U8U6_9PLEO|nr:hypothetical protein CC80DRAFT_544858 [Byssothecium circinans]
MSSGRDPTTEECTKYLHAHSALLARPVVQQDTLHGFFKLPGEIRNLIYQHLLQTCNAHEPSQNDIGAGAGACRRADGSTSIPARRDTASNILLTCGQIYQEARPLLENVATAYLPIVDRFNYMNLVDALNQKTTAENPYPGPVTTTYSSVLATFSKVHIHLHYHAHHTHSVKGLLSRLKLVLQLFIAASPTFHPSKRQAIVHFSSFFDKWFPFPCREWVTPPYPTVTPADIIGVMGGDQNTDWEVRLSQSVKDLEPSFSPAGEKGERMRVLEHLVDTADRFANVRVVVECGLDLEWSDKLGGVKYTKKAMKGSMHW